MVNICCAVNIEVVANVEKLSNRTADRLVKSATIDLVIAWRIHLMTLVGRDLTNRQLGGKSQVQLAQKDS